MNIKYICGVTGQPSNRKGTSRGPGCEHCGGHGCKLPYHGELYTAMVVWADGPGEEIDVYAKSPEEATSTATAELIADFEPGWTITEMVGPRAGLFG